MRSLPAFARALFALAALAIAVAGCGKSLPKEKAGGTGGVTTVAAPGALAANGLETKNTTRLGGTTPVADAAAVALAVHPGLTPATRPAAVVLVDERNWTAALASAALASAPLDAPILYADGNTLPAISAEALRAMNPRGSALLRGAQVIAIGTSAAPRTYRVHALGGPANGSLETPASGALETAANGSAALAAQIEQLVARARGMSPRQAIVVAADGPPALSMPAAGLAAETGAPILPVAAAGIPRATRRVLAGLHQPTIYVVGPPTSVSDAVLAKLDRYGTAHRVAVTAPEPAACGATGAGAGGEAVEDAIAVARYSDGSFGWGVEEPGHGLVFANSSRPLDAPAAAPLSASGDFGPLLLLEGPRGVPRALCTYLRDIQPSYPEYQPTRGFYNHGWLVGDEAAIAAGTQAELDTMLETAPRNGRER
jgi:hypothetical protein